MKNPEQTILEMYNHLLRNHPHLAAPLEAMAAAAQGKSRDYADFDLLLQLNRELLQQSHSQIRQDIFVLHQLNFKRGGFFVEFGATNGVDLSNTYLLEKEYGWSGILAEPAQCWHADLQKNRKAAIETRCVWTDSHSVLNFNEADEAELSTISAFNAVDGRGNIRARGKSYDVPTISLNDLLEKHHAPAVIDYLSIDTEGSEYDILSRLDFQRYAFRTITCEHNFTPKREQIFALLTQHGYTRVHEQVSQFDDWYTLAV